MALLSNRRGGLGLLAIGPSGVRRAANERRASYMAAPRAPSINASPGRPIMVDNPINGLFEGLGNVGKMLGEYGEQKKAEAQKAREKAAMDKLFAPQGVRNDALKRFGGPTPQAAAAMDQGVAGRLTDMGVPARAVPFLRSEYEAGDYDTVRQMLAKSALAEPKERATAEDVNGVLRYKDTGKPVFDGVEKERPPVKGEDIATALGHPPGSPGHADIVARVNGLVSNDQWTTLTPQDAARLGLPTDKGQSYQVNSSNNKVEALGGSGVTIHTGKSYGTIPPGYRMKFDDNGNPTGMEVIPGGPAQAEIEEAKQGKVAHQLRTQIEGDIRLQDIDRALALVDESSFWTTGFIGKNLSEIGGTDAHDLKSLLDTIKAGIGFDKLQAMRDASPTGGALGQVSGQENTLLQAAFGSVEQSQSPAQFKRNLKRLRGVYLRIIHGPDGVAALSSPKGEGEGSDIYDKYGLER